ncbi:extensin family protein [Rhizobium sp. FKL33]|uniref:extensin-like domain-containing protein n=1 Tax=Rhizobium sp. FKL33 TaxID=2562307 RepID=UPI0014859A0A|nr:extensin family protein [Rhizobium sp. FKL33]
MRIAFCITWSRRLLTVGVAVALTSCSGDLTPPADIGSETVSSVKVTRQTRQATYAAPANPAQTTENVDPYLDQPNLAGVGDPGQDLSSSTDQPLVDAAPEASQPMPSNAQAMTIPEQGVNIDDSLGVAPVGLAEEQARDIAEGTTSQPVVAGLGTDELVDMSAPSAPQTVPFDQAREANQITLPSRRREEPEQQVAFVPRFSDPMQVPESYGGLTKADKACRQDLQKLGVRFEDIPPISNGPSCGIAHPILVSGFSNGVQLKPAAKLNCNVTRAFAKWVRNELVPAARYRYFSGIKTIHQMSSYSCRKMNSRSNNPWSEHARGNAIDIGKFVLNNGKEIDVRKKGFFQFREKGLLKTVREDSCRYFTTVLGPGDPYHGDHFHFDLRARKKGYRHCSL